MIKPISPTDIPGLAMWITPDTLQPASTGLATGSPILDATGLVTLTQGTSGNQATVTFPKFAGRMALSFNGSSQSYDLANTASGPLFNLQGGSYSFAFAFNSGASSGSYSALLSKSGGGNSRMFFLINNLQFSRWSGLTGPTMQANTPYVAVYTYQYLTATTGNEYLYLNGQLAASNLNVTVSNDTINSFKIGQCAGAYWLFHDVYDICAWNSALSLSQVMSVSNYLLKQMGFLVNLVVEGNSIVYGQGASVPTTLGHAYLLKQMLQANTYYNFGVSGSRFINSPAPNGSVGLTTRIRNCPNVTNSPAAVSCPAVDFNLLIAWESTNAFWRDNVTVAQNIADTIAYFSQARALGYKCGTCTMPYASAASETKRLAYNAWMRANWQSFADFLIDYGGDFELNQPDNSGNGYQSPWFGSNAPHPNNRGHARMANIAAASTLAYMAKLNATRIN